MLDKPEGWTSFDVVAKLRGMTGQKKIGHTGTLDPMATGVLPVLLGRAAKAADLLPDSEKEYIAEFKLGEKRDTGDISGEIIEETAYIPTREELEAAAGEFIGEIDQIPPMYSAVSINGKRLYELARQGITVDRPSRRITIKLLDIMEYDPKSGMGKMKVSCSKGSYIRTLIEDVAQRSGSLGVMTKLKRTRACGFSLQEAISIEELAAVIGDGGIDRVMRSTESLFDCYREIVISPAQTVRFQNGGSLDVARLKLKDGSQGEQFRIKAPGGEFLGLAVLEQESIKLKKLFKTIDS